MSDQLLNLEIRLQRVRTYLEIFGSDIDAGLVRLQTICHPDRNQDQPDRAKTLFQKLGQMAILAKEPARTIKSPKRVYKLTRLLEAGDISDVYWAECDGKMYVLKMARVNGGDKFLTTERDALNKIMTAAGDSNYFYYFPVPAESFPIRIGPMQSHVNVFKADDNLFTLDEILQQHSDGVDGRHVAWMFNRLLEGIGFAHEQGIIHGALLPTHVLMCHTTHGTHVVGWGQSVAKGETIKAISRQFKDFYPPEVLAKRPAGPSTDIYMMAKCMLHVANQKTLPPKFLGFLNQCTLPGPNMRPTSAWDLRDEFRDLLENLYGPPKFVELALYEV